MLPQLFSSQHAVTEKEKALPPPAPKFRLSLIPGAFNILQKHSSDTHEQPVRQAVLKPHLPEPCHRLYVMNVNDANRCFFYSCGIYLGGDTFPSRGSSIHLNEWSSNMLLCVRVCV